MFLLQGRYEVEDYAPEDEEEPLKRFISNPITAPPLQGVTLCLAKLGCSCTCHILIL